MSWLSLTTWLLLCGLSTIYANIHSCGGFVKSSAPIDYSKIQVRLLTPEGHMKHEEDCNAQNGYYMIPIYNKGKYTLKVSAPEGWFFEPESIDIDLDGVNDPCSKNEDINFAVNAFAIEGVVQDGPAGITLNLVKDGKTVDSVVTKEGGAYSFKAAPGKYEVTASPSSSVCFANTKAVVEVKNAPVKVSPNLSISGYQLSIFTTNKNQPLANVPIVVYSSTPVKEFGNCVSDTTGTSKYACDLGITSSSGVLLVQCAPIGDYKVAATYKTGATEFSFEPSVAELSIKNAKKQVSFTISGFSGRGRVVSSKSKGVANAEIFVNGKKVATTDDKGYYGLNSLQEGSLEVTAKLPKTKFSVVKTKLTLPNVEIPDVVVEGFEICGSVEKADGKVDKLVLVEKSRNDKVSISPSSDGSFCKMVAPGLYTISPADASSSLAPRSLEVDLRDGHVEGLRFTHFKTDFEARVTCIGTCGSISLNLLLGSSVVQTVKGADVIFKDVGPGKYTVRIDDSEVGCWEKKEMEITIGRDKPMPIHFIQSGFITKVKLSHPANLKWSHFEQRQLKDELKAVGGVNQICVPVQGKYVIDIESCMEFSPAKLEVNVPSNSVTESTATSALVNGKLASSDKTSFSVNVKDAYGLEQTITTKDGKFSFQQQIAAIGPLTITPKSDLYLFAPKTLTIDFKGQCIFDGINFVAEKGRFLSGKITPAVENVKIKATDKSDASTVFQTLSDKNGNYKVGPVRQLEDLTIEASFDGYVFTESPGQLGALKSTKLSKLTVVIVDAATSVGLDGVLLSVVGGKEYRSNSMVEPTGEINFVGLAPGDYFLRPILQEYKFEPSTTTITVKEGEHEKVVLKGKRVSFSSFGKVREMSGEPLENIVIEALSANCDNHQSESSTDKNGDFRVRGLRPGCSYKLGVKPNTGGPHCIPPQFEIAMTAEDVKELNFVASHQTEQTELAVEIEYGSLQLVSYRVVVSKDNRVIHNGIQEAPTSVFYLARLPRDNAEYSIRVEPDKPHHAFHAKTVFFTADAAMKVVRIPLSSHRRAGDVELSMGSLLVIPFFCLVVFIFFNQNKALDLSRSLMSQLSRSASPSRDRKKRK